MSKEKKHDKSLKKKTWADPAIRKVGTVGQILHGGGGKLSITADDSGDAPRKPKGQG